MRTKEEISGCQGDKNPNKRVLTEQCACYDDCRKIRERLESYKPGTPFTFRCPLVKVE